MSPKSIGVILLLLVVSLGAGWVWGQSGKSDADQARRQFEQRAHAETARAEILEGRLAVTRTNFGDAGAHFTKAAAALEALQRQYREVGQADAAGKVEIVLATLKTALHQTEQFDLGAQSAADAALQALQGVGAGS